MLLFITVERQSMKNIIYAVKDLFCNFLNWHGRLSKQGYWYAWLGVFIVNILLLLPLNDLDVLQTNKIFFCAISLWNNYFFSYAFCCNEKIP